jgi:hypothetical protein
MPMQSHSHLMPFSAPPPSGMGNVAQLCPPSGVDGESNGENVGENINHSCGTSEGVGVK